MVSIETYEVAPPEGSYLPPNLPGGFGRAPYPDVRAFSYRDYGNRVGVFRVIEALSRFGMRATAAIDALTASNCPQIIDAAIDQKWDFACHGHSVTRVISEDMPESEERNYIRSAASIIREATGQRVTGWHGPEYGESSRTLDLLAQAGFDHVLDWPNDEQPYPISTSTGMLLSLPVAVDFDDVFAHWHRKISMERWARSIREAFDQLEGDGALSGRMLILNLHPWLIGQPWRVTYLLEVLDDIAARRSVWRTTTSELCAFATKRFRPK